MKTLEEKWTKQFRLILKRKPKNIILFLNQSTGYITIWNKITKEPMGEANTHILNGLDGIEGTFIK